jgi:hypothetical protein
MKDSPEMLYMQHRQRQYRKLARRKSHLLFPRIRKISVSRVAAALLLHQIIESSEGKIPSSSSPLSSPTPSSSILNPPLTEIPARLQNLQKLLEEGLERICNLELQNGHTSRMGRSSRQGRNPNALDFTREACQSNISPIVQYNPL